MTDKVFVEKNAYAPEANAVEKTEVLCKFNDTEQHELILNARLKL